MANEDPWSTPLPAPTNAPPSMRQLASGAEKRTRTYAPGSDKELAVTGTGRLLLLDVANGTFTANRAGSIKNDDGSPKLQDTWQLDIHVLDGETITERLDGEGDVTGTFDPPLVPGFYLPKVFVSHTVLVGQLTKAKEQGNRYLLAVVGKLPKQGSGRKPPYAFLAPAPEDEVVARQYLSNRPVAVDPF